MPQANRGNLNNSQGQSDNYQNAQSGTNRNGISQAMDPMSGDANPFEIIDKKNGDHFTQQQSFQPPNSQGMPQGMQQFQAPTSQQYNQAAPVDESASPMAKWFTKPDNSLNNQAPTATPATPAAAPTEVPAAFQSVFEKSKIEEFQALVGKRDYTKDLVTEELTTAFAAGDFSGLGGLINAAVQQGASMSAFVSSKLAHQGVNGMFENFQNATLPQLLNDHSSSTMWQAKGMESFNSPEMQPMVQMVTSHIKAQFPTASPQEQQSKALEMLQDYSKSMSEMNFAPQNPEQNQQPVVAGMSDMERLFNTP